MMQLIVTVKRLNKRSSVPVQFSDKSSIIGEVREGFQFIGEQVPANQIPNPSLGKWYVDRDGTNYWGGGITEILVPAASLLYDPVKMSWAHQLYNIPFYWDDLSTKGKNVTVAVIDTGIDDLHTDLISNIHPLSKNMINLSNDLKDRDDKAHGTRMSGIIAACGKSKIFGMAPEAKLLVLKATEKKFNADVNVFTNAVNFAASLPDVDIVSISYTFDDNAQFKQAIQNCAAKKIVLGAIGNVHDSDLAEDADTFPSCYNSGSQNTQGKEVIAVGSFDKQKNVSGFSNWNRHLSLLAPGESILTANQNNTTITEDGTSISTALASGCLALMVSYCKLHNKPANLAAQALLNSCDDMGPDTGHDIKSGFGFLNFKSAIDKIK